MNNNANNARLIVRLILGVIFLMAGWWKVFELTPLVHAEQFFVKGFTDTWIPNWLLWPLGASIPVLELLAGIFVLIGFQLNRVLFGLGFLLVITTYGHALQQPLFDIAGHTFTRLALIIYLLIAPGKNIFCLDKNK